MKHKRIRPLLISASFVVLGMIAIFVYTKIATTTPTVNNDAKHDAQQIPADIQTHIEAKSDLIRLARPRPLDRVSSPLTLTGEARGYWFFEATFPIVLTNWDGVIIAQGYATADGEWMTEDFVPFTATVAFENPAFPGAPEDHFSRRGSLILQKDNPSGLPEHDDALEIPVRF